MGQRLNIHIVDKDNNELANSYYHWSAYTMTALELGKQAIDAFYEIEQNKSELNKVQKAILMLQATGAGFTREESLEADRNIDTLDWFKWTEGDMNGYMYQPSKDRNSGFIAITEISKLDFTSWAEGDVYLDIDNQTMTFWVWGSYDRDDLEGFKIDYEMTDEDISNLPEVCFDYGTIDFSDIERLMEAIYTYDMWKDAEGNIYTKIG